PSHSMADAQHLDQFVDGERIGNADIVVWYRIEHRHAGALNCFLHGPKIKPESASPGCGSLTSCAGLCIDTSSDHDYCGKCSGTCASNQLCKQGVCKNDPCFGVDLKNDPNNCGKCGYKCDNGVCKYGKCAQDPPKTGN